MPQQETGKQRAVRIPLDYFKKGDSFSRWKIWLSAAALGIAVVWWVGGMFGGDGGRLRYTRGPVTRAHATWEDKCEACHVNFRPIEGQTHFAASFLGSGASADAKCQACHMGRPEQVHHANIKEGSTVGCAGCHHDHRGRDASLVRIEDSNCTSCHANLEAHTNGTPQYTAKITGFGVDHPRFKVLEGKRSDPGKIKFNHKLHMTPGQVGTPNARGEWRLQDIEDRAMRERYRTMQPEDSRKDGDKVVLQCASCHVADGGDQPPVVGGFRLDRPAGAYMAPVNYENHCSACHGLNVEPKPEQGNWVKVTIPHGLQADAVKNFLWGAYATQFVGQEKPAGAGAPVRAMPGKAMGPAEEQKAREAIQKQVDAASSFLSLDRADTAERRALQSKAACAECHVVESKDGKPHIADPQVPQVWLKHGRFNHATHRAVDCRGCHQNSYATEADGSSNAEASTDHLDVLLPDIDNCINCHAPSRQSGGKALGGASHDCTECHRYHNGDRPLQGPGASALDPKSPLSIDEFLSGGSR